jgi:hypothetical protein
MDQMIGEALKKTDDPLQQLHLLVEKTIEGIMHGGENFAEIMMDFWAEGVRNKDSEVLDTIDLKGIYARYRKIIKGILDNGVRQGVFKEMDSKLVAAVFIGTLDGIMLQWIMDRKAINIRKGYQVLLESMVEGIKKKDSV